MNVGIWSFDVNRGSLPPGEVGARAELISVVGGLIPKLDKDQIHNYKKQRPK